MLTNLVINSLAISRETWPVTTAACRMRSPISTGWSKPKGAGSAKKVLQGKKPRSDTLELSA